MDDSLKNFLQYVFELADGLERKNSQSDFVCEKCGQNYSKFKATGKLGCSNCYNVFRTNIVHALKNIHGTTEYLGKIPKGQGEKYTDILIKRQISANRILLKQALEKEEYEEAAKLRDDINYLKTKLNIE